MLVVNFLVVFLIAFIKQLVVYIAFAICNIYDNYSVIIIPTIILIGYLVFYFSNTDKICKLLKINKNRYDIYGFISWVVAAILQEFLLNIDSIWKIVPKSGGFMPGIEYILVPFYFTVYLLVLGIIKVIIYIIKRINNK